MSLEITGKLIARLQMQSGTSKAGNNWQKQEFVIETMDQYPKKICANLWGDRIDQLNQVNINDTVKVSFDLESREFNGKWYTDVKAWKVEPAMANQAGTAGVSNTPIVNDPFSQSMGQPQYNPPMAPQAGDNLPPIGEVEGTFTDNGGDDLPF
ncbi:MAG: DUF3127 domain-containing protein [Bacteroidales bacterium]|nr:DUF3127 domain-containing protein [Bacteroidales bacterium]